MNTEQNYVGKGDYATTLPQSAQNAAKTSSMPDDWQTLFLEKVLTNRYAKEWLFSVLELVREQLESADPIPAINAMFEAYVSSGRNNLNLQENRFHLREVMTLLTCLVELRSSFECFGKETDYANIASHAEIKKEVSNG